MSTTNTEQAADTPAEKRAAQRERESVREKMTMALLGFMLTGVIGTMVTTWVQQRGWSWQNRVAKIDKDTENAMATYRAASEIINERWHATYRMTRAIDKRASSEDWKAARDAFEQADKNWALRYTNVSREVEFHVDTPFGIASEPMIERVWTLPCDDFALRQTAQAQPGEKDAPVVTAASARVVLAVINHCHGKMKDELEGQIDNRDADAGARKALVDLSYRRLDHLYRTNEALRCIMFERASAIRRAATTESYWGTFFGIGTPNYIVAPGEKACVK